MLGDFAFQELGRQERCLCDMSRSIWENPEGPYREYHASRLCADFLEENGFAVEIGCCGIPTAVRAVYGKGSPVIGFLGEYDALPGQSQNDVDHKEPVEGQAFGHGCGHNLLAVSMAGSAVAAKKEMEKQGIGGTLVFYGCPAEEVLTGKGFMAKEGAFSELDCALAWHPGRYTRASYSVCTGVHSVKYHFKGRTAHAACDPEKGRSALDAVELMNVGINYLREHVPMDVRMHYVTTNGGSAPNIVPDEATVWYYDRALNRETMKEVEKRMEKVARGAAMMTETELTIEELGGCYPTLPNHVLGDLVDDCMRSIPQDAWTEEEIEYAGRINATVPDIWKDSVRFSGAQDKNTHIYSGVMPIDTQDDYGSTDVGDVGHIVPTTFYKTACYNIAAPGHSWQVAACVGNSIGFKGMLYGARVTALAVLRLLTQPDIIHKAKVEFSASMEGRSYECMMPDYVKPPIE